MTHIHDKIDVALFSENDLLREGLRRIIESNGFAVRLTGKDVRGLIANDIAPTGLEGGMFIIDAGDKFTMDGDCLEAIRQRYPSGRIVILHDAFDLDSMIAAFAAGADGYLVKDIPYESLVGCLRLVAMGEKVMPTALAGLLPEWGRKAQRPQPDAPITELLSARELETLLCLTRGDPNKVIAKQLNISEATVKVHVKAILRKLGLRNRTQAAAWTLHAGLDLPEPGSGGAGHCPALQLTPRGDQSIAA